MITAVICENYLRLMAWTGQLISLIIDD